MMDCKVSQNSLLVQRNTNQTLTPALWMHLLIKDIPSIENLGPQVEQGWARIAFYLHWKGSESGNKEVTLVCFGAIKHFRQRCMKLHTSKSWHSILSDPYTLVVYFFESWYERVDGIVWNANERGSKLETVGYTLESLNCVTDNDISKQLKKRLRRTYCTENRNFG